MVDRFEQEERYGPDSTIVKRAKFNQINEPYRTQEVPAKPGIKPHSTVKELPALPVRTQQDNMLQDNMLQDEEVVNFGNGFNNLNINNNFNFNHITYLMTPFTRNRL